VAVFTTADQIVVVATNEDDERSALDVVLEGVTGKETDRVRALVRARYIAGDPAKGRATSSVSTTSPPTPPTAMERPRSTADLLPVSVTVLTFDRGA
jgi:hypothetical protein